MECSQIDGLVSTSAISQKAAIYPGDGAEIIVANVDGRELRWGPHRLESNAWTDLRRAFEIV